MEKFSRKEKKKRKNKTQKNDNQPLVFWHKVGKAITTKQVNMCNTTAPFQTNYMKQTFKLFAVVLMSSVLLLTACMKKDTAATNTNTTELGADNPLGIVTPESFNWDNFSEVSLNLTFKAPDNKPLNNILVNIYNKSVEEGGVLLFTALTDKDGRLNQKIKLPAYQKEVVVDPEFMGIIRNATIRVENNAVTCTIGGVGGYSGNLVPQQNFASHGTTAVAGRMDAVPYAFMGSFSSNGVPKYLDPVNDVVETELLSFINASLPERNPVPTAHPDYLNNNANTNLDIIELSDVWITFLHEGAGYTNTLAYFTYTTGKEPKTAADIDSLHIVLPNASLSGSGGGLNPGNRVKLGRFPKGVSIGFCLIANGWNGSTVASGLDKFYSIDQLNPEVDNKQQRHSVLLYDDKRGIFLTGFEDQNRSSAGCDHDFNDLVFYSKANPVQAIDNKDVLPIDKPIDADGDGVSDVYDRFPTDPTRAYITYFPSDASFNTIAFEDNWPYMGDYDLNDLVVDYRYKMINNASNNTVEMYCDYSIRASGAAKRNGFGVQFPFASSLVYKVSGGVVPDNKVVTLASNGLEEGNTKAVIIPFDDVFTAAKVSNAFLMNTIPTNTYQKIDTIHMLVSFKSPVTSAQLGVAPFNPFLIVNRTRSQEVHLAGYQPTEKADPKLFGTGNDNTIPQKNIYYKTTSNLPYALSIPARWDYPAEHKNIVDAYTSFKDWAVSGGLSFTDWYIDPSARKNDNIYKK